MIGGKISMMSLPPYTQTTRKLRRQQFRVTIEPSYVLEVVKRFSNWFCAKRVLGRCLNIARTWRTKVTGEDTRRGVVQNFEDPVTVETMNEAE